MLSIVLLLFASGGRETRAESNVFSDKPLTKAQKDLLDLAFDTASSIPIAPHIKDRSKTQATVVAQCLELEQPIRAAGYIEKIADWRRGLACADLAMYCAQRGLENDARRCIEHANRVAETAEDWRRDRIRIRIAQVHTILGNSEQADLLEKNVVQSETGKVSATKAKIAESESFDEQMKELDALVAQGNFDVTKNALHAYVLLYDRFYASTERRSAIKNKIESSWEKIPFFIRIDVLVDLAKSALEHDDKVTALGVVNEAQTIFDKNEWPTENYIPIVAKLALVRCGAGDEQKARSDADAARALFDEEGNTIVDIWRAGALRPLAETYQAMGDSAAALAVYRQAVEEGVKNPNSRPRAEDLSATCCSMLSSKFEPDDALWNRMRQIQSGLGKPW